MRPNPDRWRGGATLVSAVLVTASAAVAVAPVLAPADRTVLVALLWGLTGVVALAVARVRPERTAAWVVVGVVDLVLLGAVLVEAGAGRVDRVPDWALALTVGGYGASMLVDGFLRRHRAGVLDALVLTVSLTTVWALLAPTDAVRGGDLGAGAWDLAVVAAGLSGIGVAVAATFTGLRRPRGTGTLPAVGLLAAATAAVLHVGGDPAGPALPEVVAWVVAGTTTTLGLLQPMPAELPHRQRGGVTLSRVAVALLYLLALAPVVVAVATGRDDAGLTAAVLVSLVCALLLSLRVMRTSTTLVESAEADAQVRFDALVRHGAEVKVLLDERGRVFYATPSLERVFGLAPSTVVDREAAELVVPDDRHLLAAAVEAAAEDRGGPVPVELRVLDGGGHQCHVEGELVDLRDVEGVDARSLSLRDVTGRKQLEWELVRRARVDDLTELARRTVLLERLDHLFRQRDAEFALLHLDVNDFTMVNDGYGHAAGDAVLREVAARVRGVLRDGDTAARIGGDEFGVLLEGGDEDVAVTAQRVSERIHAALEGPVVLAGDGELQIRVTIGIALPAPGSDPAVLGAAADTAVLVGRQAKRPTTVHHAGMNLASRHRLRMMADLERALAEHRIGMHYQPILPAAGDGVVASAPHVEALLRWTHPEDGPVRPDEAMEYALAAGLADEMTRACLDRVAADVAAFDVATGLRLHVGINLAAEQLAVIDVDDALRRLAAGGVRPDEVTFEVTETSMFADLDHVVGVLGRMRDAGCRVAVDDFGTGYASLGYLRELPIDTLKIDKRFVDELEGDAPVEGSFVAVIRTLARHLDLDTVAEGVETQVQRRKLVAAGCDLVQGYLWGRPVPMRELVERVTGELGLEPLVPVTPDGGTGAVTSG